ncbi:MAG: sensor histidine kinase [Thermoanaerobaculia bacterium]
MRLIPKEVELGWTPYAWLVYLGIFWLGGLIGHPTPSDWILTAVGTAIFLPLYFWGYWLSGRKALIAVAGITLLGIVYAPLNWGASVFFVYASGYLGCTGSAAFAFRLLLVLAALPPLEAWLVDLPPYFWVPGMVFSLLVGGTNIHYAGVRRSQAALSRTQDEVERLAKLAERERIARDLHDLLGHTLTVITRKAELARRLAEKDPARAALEIGEVEQVAREALKEVRSAVSGFRQTDFSTELAQARVALQSALIHFQSEVDAIDIDPTTEQVLALALREATTNVLRHSQADSCRVRLEDLTDQVRLTVHDNGKGNAGNDSQGQDGMGLTGMRERVTALGGDFAVDGRGGTSVTITLPLLQRSESTAPANLQSKATASLADCEPEPSGAPSGVKG